MIVPIFIPIEDCPEMYLDFEGIGKFLIAILIASVGIFPLTYSIIGGINGYDAWGLRWVSFSIGLLLSVFIVLLGDIILDP